MAVCVFLNFHRSIFYERNVGSPQGQDAQIATQDDTVVCWSCAWPRDLLERETTRINNFLKKKRKKEMFLFKSFCGAYNINNRTFGWAFESQKKIHNNLWDKYQERTTWDVLISRFSPASTWSILNNLPPRVFGWHEKHFGKDADKLLKRKKHSPIGRRRAPFY